jgi:hypothetical protein
MNVVKWTYLWIIILVHGLSASDLSIAEIQATGRVSYKLFLFSYGFFFLIFDIPLRIKQDLI